MAVPSHAPVAEDALVPLLRELITEVRGLRADLRRRDRGGPPDDRCARLFAVLGAVVGDALAFDAQEVQDHAAVDEPLASALADCGLRTPEAIGWAFRSWRDRPTGGYVLRRDGRAWRLDRCT
jgi:hypothetical protein